MALSAVTSITTQAEECWHVPRQRLAIFAGRMVSHPSQELLRRQELAPGFVFRPKLMASFAQDVERATKLFLNQDVIGDVGRDGEDGDAPGQERLDEGEQNAGL